MNRRFSIVVASVLAGCATPFILADDKYGSHHMSPDEAKQIMTQLRAANYSLAEAVEAAEEHVGGVAIGAKVHHGMYRDHDGMGQNRGANNTGGNTNTNTNTTTDNTSNTGRSAGGTGSDPDGRDRDTARGNNTHDRDHNRANDQGRTNDQNRNVSNAAMIDVAVLDRNGNLKCVTIDASTKKIVGLKDGGIDFASFDGQSSQGGMRSNRDGNERRMATDSMSDMVLRADELIGRTVVNPQGETLGKIEDLAIDPQQGKVGYAVLSHGGVLGVNDKLFAVPWNAFESHQGKRCVLDVDKATLQNAPGFDKNRWPDMNDLTWNETVHKHYNQPEYWSTSNRTRSTGMDDTHRDHSTTGGDTDTNRPNNNTGRSAGGTGSDPDGRNNPNHNDGNRNANNVDGDRDNTTPRTSSDARSSTIRPMVYRASDIIGMNIENTRDQNVGEIQDLVLHPDTGDIRYAVVAKGGFLGVNEKFVAVPWSAFTYDAQDKDLTLDVDKDTFDKYRGFDKNNWPNFADERWESDVHRQYNRQPSWR